MRGSVCEGVCVCVHVCICVCVRFSRNTFSSFFPLRMFWCCALWKGSLAKTAFSSKHINMSHVMASFSCGITLFYSFDGHLLHICNINSSLDSRCHPLWFLCLACVCACVCVRSHVCYRSGSWGHLDTFRLRWVTRQLDRPPNWKPPTTQREARLIEPRVIQTSTQNINLLSNFTEQWPVTLRNMPVWLTRCGKIFTLCPEALFGDN